MQIKLNGEAKTLENTSTIAALVDHLQLDARKIAIERNLQIVPKSHYEEEVIHDGDAIEIVECIGGG